MNAHATAIAKACLDGAEGNTMTFPQIVEMLMQAGFEGYQVDFRRAVATYYMPDGEAVAWPARRVVAPIAPGFDAGLVRDAIREAQQQVAGYTYGGFCEKVAAAGCAGYMVSFPGRRALYYGRTAETHVEHFPR